MKTSLSVIYGLQLTDKCMALCRYESNLKNKADDHSLRASFAIGLFAHKNWLPSGPEEPSSTSTNVRWVVLSIK